MKRYLILSIALALAVSLCAAPGRAVSTHASAAVLMDAGSGRVIYAHNAHEPRLIASTTKLLTALVAVENAADLDENITVKPEWTGIEGSSIYLRPNEIVSMRELLYGLLLQSGNDAAVTIACHIAGNVASFAELMNRKAAEIGMTNSHFSNPSGLNDDEHYSTAYDMALLACACLENETVAEICASRSATVGIRTFYNHNKLLGRYEGCVGMKTGYTELAGRTLVSAAVRDEQTLVCVTLNDRDDWNDHERLLDYGFSACPVQLLCRAGDRFGTVKLEGSLIPAVSAVAADDIAFPFMEGENPELSVELIGSLRAPVSAGTPVGKAYWVLDDKVVAETELICAESVNADACLRESVRERISRWLGRCVLAPNGDHLV